MRIFKILFLLVSVLFFACDKSTNSPTEAIYKTSPNLSLLDSYEEYIEAYLPASGQHFSFGNAANVFTFKFTDSVLLGEEAWGVDAFKVEPVISVVEANYTLGEIKFRTRFDYCSSTNTYSTIYSPWTDVPASTGIKTGTSSSSFQFSQDCTYDYIRAWVEFDFTGWDSTDLITLGYTKVHLFNVP
ncbi:MAG: hypothetical protein ACREOI_21655 [bacterium]